MTNSGVIPGFPNGTDWMGEYATIAVLPGTTTVLASWTDMRDTACFAGVCRHGQDAYFAAVP